MGFKVKGEAAVHRPCRKFHAGKPFALPSAGGAHGGSRLRTQPSPRDFPRRSRAAELGAGDRGIPPEHPKRAAAPLHAPATSSAAQAEISQFGVQKGHGLAHGTSPRSPGLRCPCAKPPTARQARPKISLSNLDPRRQLPHQKRAEMGRIRQVQPSGRAAG